MIALVEDSITEKELRREPSKKLLIIDRCPFGILLSFEVLLHFMKPGFICNLFGINLVAVRWFIQPLNGDSGSFIPHLNLNIEDMVANASAN